MKCKTARGSRNRVDSAIASRKRERRGPVCRVANARVEALEDRQLLSTLVAPSHIVVVVEQSRAANAIGNVAQTPYSDMPYLNSLASTGLVYSNSQGLNTSAQTGQMNYLALYSGSTQGVTTNSNNGVFTTPTLASSLSAKGLTFDGFSESLPSNGDTTDNYAASPTNPAYDDLYVRSDNPMAQFSNVGAGLTNASVNQTFAGFPTTAAGFASLPTVSFVIPNTLHNTNGSNDTDPYATDPNAYDLLRQDADTWLQQNLDAYVQWAKQNNSLLIVTDAGADKLHNFAGSFATIVNGSTNLFVPGVDTTSVTPYNILATIEDMYGLTKLGNTTTAADLDTTSLGLLGSPTASPAATTTSLSSSAANSLAGQTVTFTATVSPVPPATGTPTGSVTFMDGATVLGTSPLNGSATATFATSTLSVASHSITAVYGDDANFAASTSTVLTETITAATQGPLVTPTHIVIVVEEDRAADAIGNTAIEPYSDMPYFNQLASTGLVYSNSHGLNTVDEDGQMTYLGLYSGGTQGVTDDADHGIFTVPTLASALAAVGKTFSGYAENLPYAGDMTDDYAASPTDPAYDDLYTRAYNPMAQFSNVGVGITNAQVNQPFSAFPTTSAGFAALPTVSIVIPDTLHNTHGSNDTDPYATDPSEYDFLRQNADTWLKQNLDAYVQWAKQNNSLLIVTDDEGDRATNFANGFATIVAGSTNLFVPGVDTTNVTAYNILRTVEDMYGLAKLGNSATAADLDTTVQGLLGAPTAGPSATSTSLKSSAANSVTGQSVTFTATVSPVPPATGTPTGTVSFMDGATVLATAALNGSATATFTTSTLPVASHSITAVYNDDANFTASTSPVVTQTVAADSTTTAVTSPVNPSVWGQSVTFTATVSPDAPGSGTPTGSVKFMDGTTLLGTQTLSNAGTANFTISSLSVASHSITAVYLSDLNFAGSTSVALAQSVIRDSTTTGLQSSINPSIAGQSVTFTATVSAAAPGSGTPTGSINFMDGSTLLGTSPLNNSGVTTFSLSTLTNGPHSITAAYSSDANFAASVSPALVQSVGSNASAVALISSANPSVAGQSVTFTASVSAVAPATGTPTGQVNFMDGTALLQTVALDGLGNATFTSSTLTVASHSITAVYTGDANFTGSTSTTFTQTVNRDSSTTTVKSSANPSVAGQSVTFTATVASAAPGSGTPTGSVKFMDGTTLLATVALSSGTATFTTTALSVASHSITAAYADDANFAPSTSAKLTQTVNKDSTTTTVVSSLNPAVNSQAVTFTATVAPVAPGSGTPTGNVKFMDGTTVLATLALSSGTAAYTTSTLSAASHSITAAYVGDANFAAGVSAVLTEKVTATPPNDNFANAIVLTGASVTVMGTNYHATKEKGEPNHAGNAGGASVWYTWTAPTSGTVTIDTHGSTFDTLLAVYTGSSVSALTAVASNDDDWSSGVGLITSKVTFAVKAGTVYRIAVDGYSAAMGNITLHIALS